jgi:RNase P protein component
MGDGEDHPLAWRSLRDRRQFAEIYRHGVGLVGRLLVVYMLPAEDYARAVVASRKVGNSVQRNRAKRLLRESLRQSELSQPGGIRAINERYFPEHKRRQGMGRAETGLWVVLIARRRILTVKTQAVIQEIERLLSRR